MWAGAPADTWAVINPNLAGTTWPMHLEDPVGPVTPSTPSGRIDLVLERGVTPLADTLVGNSTADLTPSGLWPSDHAGVLATIGLS